jgi:hypothetical protein
MLHSIRRLNDDTSLLPERLTECPVTGNSSLCAKIVNLGLDLGGVKMLVSNILDALVSRDLDGSGFLELVAEPFITLNEPLPGVSDIANKDITILTVAEIYRGAASGVATVKKILEIYDAIKTLKQTFDESGLLLIANSCAFDSSGFRCTGGLFDDDDDVNGTRRALSVPSSRALLGEEGCNSTCTGNKIKCKAKEVACKANAIEGLSFPLLEDPKLVLNLLKSEDVVLFDFSPPEVTFSFEAELAFIVWTPPIVVNFYFSEQNRFSLP